MKFLTTPENKKIVVNAILRSAEKTSGGTTAFFGLAASTPYLDQDDWSRLHNAINANNLSVSLRSKIINISLAAIKNWRPPAQDRPIVNK
jgi:hypothetical protein